MKGRRWSNLFLRRLWVFNHYLLIIEASEVRQVWLACIHLWFSSLFVQMLHWIFVSCCSLFAFVSWCAGFRRLGSWSILPKFFHWPFERSLDHTFLWCIINHLSFLRTAKVAKKPIDSLRRSIKKRRFFWMRNIFGRRSWPEYRLYHRFYCKMKYGSTEADAIPALIYLKEVMIHMEW